MKKFLALSLMGLASAGAFAQFTLDNLVVVRVGTGAAALTNAANEAFIDQYTTAGTLVNTTTTGLFMSGTATSEGALYNGIEVTVCLSRVMQLRLEQPASQVRLPRPLQEPPRSSISTLRFRPTTR